MKKLFLIPLATLLFKNANLNRFLRIFGENAHAYV